MEIWVERERVKVLVTKHADEIRTGRRSWRKGRRGLDELQKQTKTQVTK